MRTLLRHALTGQYYQRSGKWTSNPSRAHNFKAISQAINIARQAHSANLELDFSFDTPQQAAVFRLNCLFGDS